MILSRQTICAMAESHNIIKPFFQRQVCNGMSFGVSQAGYDIRIRENITLYPTTLGNLVLNALGLWRPTFVLASSIELFNVPDNMVFHVVDKSSWARRGLAVQNTVAEPGWRGYLTLELTNHGDKIIHLHSGDPIAQVMFSWLDMTTDQPYNGKYQDQPPLPVVARHEISGSYAIY